MAWLFVSWERIAIVVASTAAMYVSVLVGVRLAGRRTVTQMSAFDFVVTVGIGSLAATVSVQPDPPVAQGVAVLVTLLTLQVGLAWARRSSRLVQRLLDFSPMVAVRDGTIDRDTLKSIQMTEEELFSKLRRAEAFEPGRIRLAVIEPTGELSLLYAGQPADERLLRDPLEG